MPPPGLGLAMVFGIIHRPLGTITIESEPGKGTTFTLRFPTTHGGVTTVPDPVNSLIGPWRILVVEDKPILCHLLCEQLQEDFHTVEMALSGSEALRKFPEGRFDLVITDHRHGRNEWRATGARATRTQPVNAGHFTDRLRDGFEVRKPAWRGHRPRPREARVARRASPGVDEGQVSRPAV